MASRRTRSRTQLWCSHCDELCPVSREGKGMRSCSVCGKILAGTVTVNTSDFQITKRGEVRFVGSAETLLADQTSSEEESLTEDDREMKP